MDLNKDTTDLTNDSKKISTLSIKLKRPNHEDKNIAKSSEASTHKSGK